MQRSEGGGWRQCAKKSKERSPDFDYLGDLSGRDRLAEIRLHPLSIAPSFCFSSAPFSRRGRGAEGEPTPTATPTRLPSDAPFPGCLGCCVLLTNQRGEASSPRANRLPGQGPRRLNRAGDWCGQVGSVARLPLRAGGTTCRRSAEGPAMPTRAEDYEVLYTIGTGSYGRCQKIRRKSDGKVSAGHLGVSAPAAVSPACGERPRPLGWRKSGRPGALGPQGGLPARAYLFQVCVCPGSRKGWETAPVKISLFLFSSLSLPLSSFFPP